MTKSNNQKETCVRHLFNRIDTIDINNTSNSYHFVSLSKLISINCDTHITYAAHMSKHFMATDDDARIRANQFESHSIRTQAKRKL